MIKKKIVFHIITSLGNGGAEGVLFRLCVNEKEFNHVVINLQSGGKYQKMLLDNNIKVISLGLKKWSLNIRSFIKLFKSYRFFKPHIIQGWMYHGDLIASILSILVGHKLTFWNIRNSTLTSKANNYISTYFVLKLCSLISHYVPKYIVGCSKSSLIYHSKLGYKNQIMKFIPNGIEMSKFYPSKKFRTDLRKNLSINNDLFLFGMVARFDPQKDHNNLFSALKMLKESGKTFGCLLAGSQVNKNNIELMQQIEDNNLKDEIYLLGERLDVNKIFSALDCHILSSSYGEAFPNVIAESMACGTPCIATDVGDTKEIIGETGWVVPIKNSKLLYDSMVDIINKKNEDTFLELKLKAVKRVEKYFTLSKMINAYNSLYKGESI